MSRYSIVCAQLGRIQIQSVLYLLTGQALLLRLTDILTPTPAEPETLIWRSVDLPQLV